MKNKFLAILAIELLAGSVVAGAAVIYENPVNLSATDAGAISEFYQDQHLAQQFNLASTSSVNRASWYGTMFRPDPLDTGDTWSFYFAIYLESDGLPGLRISEAFQSATVTDTGIDIYQTYFDPERLYLFSADFPSTAPLEAGTNYWFSIVNPVRSPLQFRWTQATSGLNTAFTSFGEWVDMSSAATRAPLNVALYFETPEPGSLALLGLGLAGLGLSRRRKAT